MTTTSVADLAMRFASHWLALLINLRFTPARVTGRLVSDSDENKGERGEEGGVQEEAVEGWGNRGGGNGVQAAAARLLLFIY